MSTVFKSALSLSIAIFISLTNMLLVIGQGKIIGGDQLIQHFENMSVIQWILYGLMATIPSFAASTSFISIKHNYHDNDFPENMKWVELITTVIVLIPLLLLIFNTAKFLTEWSVFVFGLFATWWIFQVYLGIRSIFNSNK